MWLFGYGSLIWKAGFAFEEKKPAYLRGWARRFWQESADHRGTPEAPGRVVTLVPEPGRVWGMAYRLDEGGREAILESLDVREQGGYHRRSEPIFDRADQLVARALVYVGDETNPRYAGAAPIEEIARRIVRSEGPSGHNVEYLLRLARSLADLGCEDPHVSELTARVEALADDALRARFAELFAPAPASNPD